MWEFLLTKTPLLYFTQSLWRDEAFSILSSELPLTEILPKLSFEPPVYYTLLHFWMKIFGNSEISARSLSLLGFALATVVVIYWAEALFKKHWLRWFLPVIFFLNPMLLYYAFEVRTYGWYMFFATLTMYMYHQKRWRGYTIAAILGFYTHTYMVFLLVAQGIHYLATHRSLLHLKRIGKTFRDPFMKSALIIFAVAFPWIIRILIDASKLGHSWFFPVDVSLIYSVLGNMFVGYEGTPWYFWTHTRYISLVLLGFFALAMWRRSTRKKGTDLLFTVLVPLAVVIGISFVKPLFVNRYLLPVTIAQVILLTLGIHAIRHPVVQKLTAVAVLLFVVGFNIWYPDKHAKVPIRDTIMQINTLKGDDDVILTKTSLVLFESIYYSDDRSRVFLYNPQRSPFPWYVGDAIYSESLETDTLPPYPIRAFLVHEDGSFEVVYRATSSIASGTSARVN